MTASPIMGACWTVAKRRSTFTTCQALPKSEQIEGSAPERVPRNCCAASWQSRDTHSFSVESSGGNSPFDVRFGGTVVADSVNLNGCSWRMVKAVATSRVAKSLELNVDGMSL